MSTSKILRTRDVCVRLGVSRATLASRVKHDATFPRPIALAPNVRGFDAAAIDAWLAAQPAAADVPNAAQRDAGRRRYWDAVRSGEDLSPRARAHRDAVADAEGFAHPRSVTG